MTPEQAAKNSYDPFDDTKVWLHSEFPLIPVGRFVLNKNPKNYFAEIEQIGFDPAHLIPGKRYIQFRILVISFFKINLIEFAVTSSSDIFPVTS